MFCLPLVGIKELEKEKLSLQSDSESYSDQVTELISGLMQHFVILSVYCHLLLKFTLLQFYLQVQRLQQKLHIMTEMYQENELKLHRYNCR